MWEVVKKTKFSEGVPRNKPFYILYLNLSTLPRWYCFLTIWKILQNIPLHFNKDVVGLWKHTCLPLNFAWFKPYQGHFFFAFYGLLHPGVRVLGKNGYSTSLSLLHGTSLFKLSTKNYSDSIFMIRRKVAEVGQIICSLQLYYAKMGYQKQESIFF